MVINEQIKIGNIYYMLAYAFQTLRTSGYADLATEDFDNIQHLLAAILQRGVSVQLKRGMSRDYLEGADALFSPRGKIEFTDSLRELSECRLVCRFDEFSENIHMNQILKICLELLAASRDIPSETTYALRNLLRYFYGVENISLREIRWDRLFWHRHNAAYEMLLNICRLLLEGLLPRDSTGERRLSAWLDEQRMCRLYEKFILTYYQREHPRLSASSPQIGWSVDDGVTSHLPTMHTDIVLKSKSRTIIIDAKYYTRSMQINPFNHKATLWSHNLYQIYTYVKNMDKDNTGAVSGLLLYAKTNEAPVPDADYSMGGNRISVRSLDLAENWTHLKSQLDDIAGLLY